MKFLVEPGPEPRCMVLHFDVPVEGLLPRLLDYHEKEEPHDTNPHLMVRYRIGVPKVSLKGIEVIKPMTRYAMVVVVGKAFLIQETLKRIIDALEIVTDDEEWGKWMYELGREAHTIEQATREMKEQNDPLLSEIRKHLDGIKERISHSTKQPCKGSVRKKPPVGKGTRVRNRGKLGS